MIEAHGLFQWKSEVVLQTTSGSATVQLRTLGGVEDEQRGDAALAASMIAKAELENTKSQLYTHHIAPLKTLNREGVIDIILALQRGLFIREAQWRVEPLGTPDPPEEQLVGTDVVRKPGLNDILKWQDKRDSLHGELEERRAEWVGEQVEALEKELRGLKKAELQKKAVNLHSGAIVERAYNREWDWQTVFLGSFKDEDCTRPFFKTVQEVRGLPRPVFLKVASAYLELDAFSKNPDALKNSS